MKENKRGGLERLTPQRLAILEFLANNKEHPAASEIYEAVSKKFPTMSLATVYNTLKALKKKENVLELAIDPDKKRFDPDTARHHHLICTVCRRIVDVYSDFTLELSKEEQHDFEITGNHVDFYGICPRCRLAKADEEKNQHNRGVVILRS
jgi:Fur family transcriptional regulator, peroxide stress response regulator